MKSMRPQVRQVTIDDPFWSGYLKKIRENMLPNVLDKFEEVGYLENYRFAAEGIKEHKGPPFSDGLLLEAIRGVSDFLAIAPDSEIEARLDKYIALIAADADDDGFLYTAHPSAGKRSTLPWRASLLQLHRRAGKGVGDV